LVSNHTLQVAEGVRETDMLSSQQLQNRFPWLNTADVLAASHSYGGAGWFDPWALLRAMKMKATEMGVTFVHGSLSSAVRSPITKRLERVQVQLGGNKGAVSYSPKFVVNAAGAKASAVQDQLVGGDPAVLGLPVRPRKRCIFFFKCSVPVGTDLDSCPEVAPLTVDPSGVYFRSEGAGGAQTFLAGVSPKQEDDVDCWDPLDLENADHTLWEEVIWPALFNRVQAFGELKVTSSWAGLYDYNTCDQNGIVGFHPDVPNLLCVTGFSGHGLQQSPAAGRAGSELIEYGEFHTLDLSRFGVERLSSKDFVFETGIV